MFFKPLIAHNILQSIDLLADSSKNFGLYCIRGLKADKDIIKSYLNNSLMLVTALAPKIGYDNAAKIAKSALKNKTTLKTEALKTGLINEKDYDKIVNPKNDLSCVAWKNEFIKFFNLTLLKTFFPFALKSSKKFSVSLFGESSIKEFEKSILLSFKL